MAAEAVLHAGDLSLELTPAVGGSIGAFEAEREGRALPLLRPASPGSDDALNAACFPLVPFANRVRDGRFTFRGRTIQLPIPPGQKHPMHGQGWRNPWTLSAAGAATATLDYRHAADEWPWDYVAQQTIALDERGLSLTLRCRNLSAETMPCGLGYHPYFPCGEETTIDTGVEAVWTVDKEVMPVERLPATDRYDLRNRRVCGQSLDNGFSGWDGEARIHWPPRRLRLTMRSHAPRFQLYSPKRGRVFVAEPVTNANAALNRPEAEWEASGLALLEKGEETVLEARFDVFLNG